MAADHGYVIPARYWAWAGSPAAVRVWAWAFAVAVAGHHLDMARRFDRDPPGTPAALRRPNPHGHGHVLIDFGGQWVMGRMVVEGQGRRLYHRQAQWEVVRAAFPAADEAPAVAEDVLRPKHDRRHYPPNENVKHDADRLMGWFMGADPPAWGTAGGAVAAPLGATNPFAAVALNRAAADAVTPAVVVELDEPAVGGPLYPPVHALLYAPLGLIDRPHSAYTLFQFLALGFTLLAALGVSRLTNGRVWWSLAFAGLLLYPGSRAGMELGQNPALSTCILVWGWVLAARGRELAGGAVWGLFAFKPVWGLAFFLVPVLMRRWRFALAMVGTGAALGLLTLPVVGLQAWFDWLAVGREATDVYAWSYNWVSLSRDLQGIPRRFLTDFTLPEGERDTPAARAWGWGLWAAVFVPTVLVYLLRADRRRPVGVGAAFLFTGAILTGYRFMYYDLLLSAVGFALLLAVPGLFRPRAYALTPADGPPPDPLGPTRVAVLNSFPLTVLAGLFIVENILHWIGVDLWLGAHAYARVTTAADGATGVTIPKVRFETTLFYPWETVLLVGLWAWCGVRLLWGRERSARDAVGVDRPV